METRKHWTNWRWLLRTRACGLAIVWAALNSIVMTLRAAEPGSLPLLDEKWSYFASSNFELYSRQSPERSRQVLQHLELLRAVFTERMKAVERTKLEVTVYFFRTQAEFQAYAPESTGRNSDVKGFYMAFPDRAIICLAPIDNWENAGRLIFHEYVHHLFRSTDANPPVWYNEGMAELIASIESDGETIEIGHPHPGRIATLLNEKFLPLESLFGVDDDSPLYRSRDHAGLFYAQSWALLHYWYCGDSGLSKDAILRFVQVAGDRKKAAAVDLPAYFKVCFGIDYATMQRRLEIYIRDGQYRYSRQPAPKTPPPESYATRAVPPTELQLRLAELAVRTQRSARANFMLVDAATNGTPDPRVFEVLGMNAILERNENDAKARWEQAIAAGSRNVAVNRELGLLEARAWLEDFNYSFRLPPELRDRLRARLQGAITQEPYQTAAYEHLAWVEAFSDEPSIANINLVQNQFAVLKEKQRTALALALIRLRMGRVEEAKKILNSLGNFDPDPWTLRAAGIVRGRLGGSAASVVTNREQQATGAALRGFRRYPSVQLPDLK